MLSFKNRLVYGQPEQAYAGLAEDKRQANMANQNAMYQRFLEQRKLAEEARQYREQMEYQKKMDKQNRLDEYLQTGIGAAAGLVGGGMGLYGALASSGVNAASNIAAAKIRADAMRQQNQPAPPAAGQSGGSFNDVAYGDDYSDEDPFSRDDPEQYLSELRKRRERMTHYREY